MKPREITGAGRVLAKELIEALHSANLWAYLKGDQRTNLTDQLKKRAFNLVKKNAQGDAGVIAALLLLAFAAEVEKSQD